MLMIMIQIPEIISPIKPTEVNGWFIGFVIAVLTFIFYVVRNEYDHRKKNLDFENEIKSSILEDQDLKSKLVKDFYEETGKWRDFVIKQFEARELKYEAQEQKFRLLENALNLAQQQLSVTESEASKVPNLVSMSETLETKVGEISAQLYALIEENMNLRTEGETRKVLITERDREIAKLKFEIRTLKDDLERKKSEIEIKDQQISEYIIKLQEYTNKLEKLQQMLNDREDIRDERSSTDSERNNPIPTE